MNSVTSHTPSEQGQHHQIRASINVQPQNLDTPQSNPTLFSRRMPQSLSQRSHALSQPEPSHRKRPHEMTPSRHLKHHHIVTAIAPIRQAGSNHTSRPDCRRRQLDRRYLRAIIPRRTARSRPFGHHRGRRQLCRKYFVFCCICRQAHRSFIQRSHRLFPYKSLEGNVCYLIVYHYESNAILGLPISGFNDNTVFAAYKTQFEFLESKAYKIKLNVMDNQCTKQIKKILTDNDCELMLVEPHNHHINAAERAIQTFKDHLISALATTDSEFPPQLWVKLTSQVETNLNLMRASQIKPRISAYEAIWGPYDWNCFPLAPPGCKAVTYESPTARGLWGSRETDAWYLGLSLDHYRCNHYFIPETQAYRISGRQSYSPNTARSNSCQQMIICKY